MKLSSDKRRRTWFIIGILAPVFLLHAVVNLLNRLFSMALSLFEWNGYMPYGNFVGLDNIKRMLKDELVWQALRNNIFLAFWTLVFTVSLALFLAYAVTRLNFRENKLYETVFFFPNTLSMVIISLLWLFVFNPSFGPASALLRSFGTEPPVWLGDPNWVKPAIIVPQVWASVGFYFLIYVAAIKNIPQTLYEAAQMDGASSVRQFFTVTLPLIRHVIATTIIFNFVTSFNGGFTIVKIMTGGGPNGASEVLATYLYAVGIDNFDYGYGAAIGLLSVVMSIVVYLLLTRMIRTEAYEY